MPDDLDPNDESQQESSVMKELRDQVKRLGDAEARASALEQKLALTEAGLTGLNDEQREALSSVHKDEWTAEALKATASRLGFGATQAPEPPQIPADEMAAHRRVAEAAGGIPPDAEGDAAVLAQLQGLDDRTAQERDVLAILTQAGLVDKG